MLQVDPDQIAATGVGDTGTGAELDDVCRSLSLAMRLIESAGGDVELAAAASQFAHEWLQVLGAAAAHESARGARVVGAAAGYAATEFGAVEGFGGTR